MSLQINDHINVVYETTTNENDSFNVNTPNSGIDFEFNDKNEELGIRVRYRKIQYFEANGNPDVCGIKFLADLIMRYKIKPDFPATNDEGDTSLPDLAEGLSFQDLEGKSYVIDGIDNDAIQCYNMVQPTETRYFSDHIWVRQRLLSMCE